MREIGEHSFNLVQSGEGGKGFQKRWMGAWGTGNNVGCPREGEMRSEQKSECIKLPNGFTEAILILLVSSLDNEPSLSKCDSVLHSGKCTSPKVQNFASSSAIACLEYQMWPIGHFCASTFFSGPLQVAIHSS